MSRWTAAASVAASIGAAAVWGTAAGAASACAPPDVRGVARLPQHGVLSGDLDGDGRADRTGLAVARGNAACRYVLWALVASGTAAITVRQPSFAGGGVYPYLAELALVDRAPGADIVVDFGIGTGVHSYGLYRVRAGRLVRVPVLGTSGPALDTFQAGATIAGAVGTICAGGARSGAVLSASYSGTAPPRRPPVTGAYYREHAGAYRIAASRHRLTAAERRQWLAARRAPIFGNCAVAVAR